MSVVGCRVWEQKTSSFYHVQSAHNHKFFTIYISNFYFESCEISLWDSGRWSISLLLYTGSWRASAHFYDKPVKCHSRWRLVKLNPAWSNCGVAPLGFMKLHTLLRTRADLSFTSYKLFIAHLFFVLTQQWIEYRKLLGLFKGTLDQIMESSHSFLVWYTDAFPATPSQKQSVWIQKKNSFIQNVFNCSLFFYSFWYVKYNLI